MPSLSNGAYLVPFILSLGANAGPIVTGRAPPAGPNGVIVQMFQWSWDSVAAECTNFLGPAGYGLVQVSPPAEHITGTQWWTDYQPVSYNLNSKRGNRDQFKNMVNTCHSAGVKVIVDSIWNHMSGMDSGVGIAGSNFTKYTFPGIYEPQDFHHCGLEPNDDIVNYDDRKEVQTCKLSGLADLATETDYVRGRLAGYANDLLSLGVDGFRLDAAKHIASGDIANILSRLTSKPGYVTQEIYSSQTVSALEYTQNGDAQEFQYTQALKDSFEGPGISNLLDVASRPGWVPSESANVFVANHDTERYGTSLNYKSSSNTYTLATIFTLGFPYGTPTVLSGYEFNQPSGIDDGSPNGGSGTCSGSGGANGWLCQHRWTAIAGMVGFRNTVGTGAALNNWVTGVPQQIAFGRGDAGYLIINNGDGPWARTFATSLPEGSYCDVISGATTSGGGCSGASYTVAAGGSLTTTVPGRTAVALHIGAKGTGSTTTVSFAVNTNTTLGDNIFVVGDLPALGGWSPDKAILLSSETYPVWKATAPLDPNVSFKYQYIRKTATGEVVWGNQNRTAISGAAGTGVALSDSSV